ncbi:MAG: hypothetical protein EOL87_09295 [Spartobacteria bacterium]|nr:hypothetical protein [Spartobacteria bacterium]
MTDILKMISFIVGGVLFIISLALGMASNDGVTTDVAFRSIIVFIIGTTVTGIFFRFFASVLYNFVIERMEEQDMIEDEDDEDD